MKKLMVAFAAIAMTVAAQAATCSWTITNVYAGNTTDKATGIAYFMTTAMATIDSWTAGISQSDAAALVGNAYNWTPDVAGTYSKATASAVSNADLHLNDSTEYTFYAVIFNGSTIADSTSFFVTNTKTTTTMTGTSNRAISFMSQQTGSQQAWTEMAPEPTSGLMMLLGMGVLALRRRRA